MFVLAGMVIAITKLVYGRWSPMFALDRRRHRRIRDRRHRRRARDRPGRGARRPAADRQRLRAGVRSATARRARWRCPADLQWMVNPREDVLALLEQAQREARERRRCRRSRRSRARAMPPTRSSTSPRSRARPDRGRQQGDDRRQAVPARLGAEQGLAPRAVLGADRADDLTRGPATAPPATWRQPLGRRAGVEQAVAVVVVRHRARRAASPSARAARASAPASGVRPSTRLAITSAAVAETSGAAIEVP